LFEVGQRVAIIGQNGIGKTTQLRTLVGELEADKGKIKWKLTTKNFSIFSNSSHFEWKAGLSDTILKGDHPRTIPAKFALIPGERLQAPGSL
jgi:ATPase subunit of ABC transporter with duplicated ATPase domains